MVLKAKSLMSTLLLSKQKSNIMNQITQTKCTVKPGFSEITTVFTIFNFNCHIVSIYSKSYWFKEVVFSQSIGKHQINLKVFFVISRLDFRLLLKEEVHTTYSGMPKPGLPGVFLADQFTLFQPGWHIRSTLYYWHPQLISPSGIPDTTQIRYVKVLLHIKNLL